MSMTDPIADFLTRIRNGIQAAHETVDIPASKLKIELARILREQGYIDGYEVEAPTPEHPGEIVRITLKYTDDRRSAISGLRRVSRPGQRRYVAANGIPKVQGGMGTTILSTSSGVMTGHEARQQGVGGEVVAEGWWSRREPDRQAAHPLARRRHRDGRARRRARRRSEGRALRARAPRHEDRADRRRAAGEPPDQSRRAPRPPRAHTLAGLQHGRGRHERLHEDARDPGRRLPRAAEGQGPRAGARLLAPRAGEGARRHRVRGAPAHARDRQGDLQAAGRRDRRLHPQAAPARALQGQGHPLRGRVRRPEGRQARMTVLTKPDRRLKRRRRVRAKVVGTAERPRISVFRSNRGISAQLVDDLNGRTVAAAQWTEADLRDLKKAEQATKAGEFLAQRAKAAGIETAVFDRGGYQYHGRVKAFADGVREGGIAV